MKVIHLLILTVICTFSAQSFAWDGQVTGVIQNIDVTAGENFGFRIALKDAPKLCGNNNTWAFLFESDSNYKTFVSVLLAAKLAERSVVIYTNQDASGYCHIGYISLY